MSERKEKICSGSNPTHTPRVAMPVVRRGQTTAAEMVIRVFQQGIWYSSNTNMRIAMMKLRSDIRLRELFVSMALWALDVHMVETPRVNRHRFWSSLQSNQDVGVFYLMQNMSASRLQRMGIDCGAVCASSHEWRSRVVSKWQHRFSLDNPSLFRGVKKSTSCVMQRMHVNAV